MLSPTSGSGWSLQSRKNLPESGQGLTGQYTGVRVFRRNKLRRRSLAAISSDDCCTVQRSSGIGWRLNWSNLVDESWEEKKKLGGECFDE